MKLLSFHANLVMLLLALSKSFILGYSLEYNHGNETDLVALLAIKSQLIEDSNGVLSSWNHSQHHCDWEGVTCGHKHQRVTMLDLHSRRLSGTISPFVGNLSFLRYLLLHKNKLHGQIPNEIGRLSRLSILHLTNNTLVGEVPANLSGCHNLQTLDLGVNKLEGRLPLTLGTLTNLRVLEVSKNNFTGPFFKVIANLTSLEGVFATYNSFTGNIPDSIARMRNLQILGLGNNEFTGEIPPSLFNLSSLQVLELAYNNLRGKIPSNVGDTLPQLEALHLSGNYLAGPFPISLLNITSLHNLILQDNNLTNEVTLDFSRLYKLEYLMLSENKIGGSIDFLSTLTNCSSLIFLGFTGNKLMGLLPKSVANLSTNLQLLGIGRNQIIGEIPTGISNLVSLRRLLMNDNHFTGSIPNDFGKLLKIEQLWFQNNKLVGSIPNFFTNLSRLSLLYMSGTKIQGSIPLSLWSCQNLLYLDLSNNDLSGHLPKEILHGKTQLVELNLSCNHLNGSLPSILNKQASLESLDVSQNKLSGEIPSGLANCHELQLLYMGGNFFQGSIPQSFSSLQDLQELNLSHNNLSGPFPNYVSTFPLVYLDLSYNNFEGEVPTTGIFANASRISLVGNDRLCGGIPELKLARCIEEKKTKRKLQRLISWIIPIICAPTLLVIAACLYYYKFYNKKERRPIPSDSTTRGEFLKVSYSMLHKATDGFSSERLLGKGSFGSVFKGILEPDGNTVAVKVLNLQHQGALKSFMAECKALGNIRHRNLLEIITTCSSIDFQGNDFKALIYKFMSNGNLDKWLHEDGDLVLSLEQRVDIAIHVASALDYLHHDCEPTIVHCDLKPSNILLDDDMVAHVGDFGLAKFLPEYPNPNQSSSIGIMGTVGYAAPEYGLGGQASPTGDIYSFGILLLELMTGKRPTGNLFGADFNLHKYAKAASPDQVLQIVDPVLTKQDSEEEDEKKLTQIEIQPNVECMVAAIRVGVECSNDSPRDRMGIKDALNELQKARNIISSSQHMNKTEGGDENQVSFS